MEKNNVLKIVESCFHQLSSNNTQEAAGIASKLYDKINDTSRIAKIIQEYTGRGVNKFTIETDGVRLLLIPEGASCIEFDVNNI